MPPAIETPKDSSWRYPPLGGVDGCCPGWPFWIGRRWWAFCNCWIGCRCSTICLRGWLLCWGVLPFISFTALEFFLTCLVMVQTYRIPIRHDQLHFLDKTIDLRIIDHCIQLMLCIRILHIQILQHDQSQPHWRQKMDLDKPRRSIIYTRNRGIGKIHLPRVSWDKCWFAEG